MTAINFPAGAAAGATHTEAGVTWTFDGTTWDVTSGAYATKDEVFFPGEIRWLAGSVVPLGWLKANGAAVSRTTYAALFAAITTTYGAGDGSTTFALPDLRGEFIRGWDDGKGTDAGRALGSKQAQSIQNHVHNNGNFVTGGPSGSQDGSTISRQDGTGETRPRNIALMAVIRT